MTDPMPLPQPINIILCTLNARYIHSSFGLRYLYAQLGALQQETKLLEFDISDWPVDVAEQLLKYQPKIIGIGVYVWNARQSLELVTKLKQIAPQIKIVLGGPEVSYESEEQEICHLADYVIRGEADLEFSNLAKQLLLDNPRAEKFIQAGISDLDQLNYPYQFYSERDLEQRIVYVEASRGCPFTCEFCLSSLEIPVRQFEVTRFLEQMQQLLDRGAKNFKFVDRTFNLNLRITQSILTFFIERLRPGLLFHFEMIPDRLPAALVDLLAQFPAGTLQLEIGIQTFNPEVSARISRRQDYKKIEQNLSTLRTKTNAHLHVDLIAGLPGEDLESFAAGFNQLVALSPHEIQVGILKRLRGTPIVRHDQEWKMVYSKEAPYEILQNSVLSFEELQAIRRFARYWDLVANSANFPNSLKLILDCHAGPFAGFFEFSQWLFAKAQTRHGIARARLAELIKNFLVECRSLDLKQAQDLVEGDLDRNKPEKESNRYAKRQSRHLVVSG